VNNSILTRIHGCILAISVDEEKRECQVGVRCEKNSCECVVWT